MGRPNQEFWESKDKFIEKWGSNLPLDLKPEYPYVPIIKNKPIKNVEVRGFGMLADWRWNSSGTSFVITETGVKVDSIVFDAKGIHIGNAPQKQIGGSIRLELFKDFYIKPQFNFFYKMYAQFDPNKLVLDNSTKKPKHFLKLYSDNYNTFLEFCKIFFMN